MFYCCFVLLFRTEIAGSVTFPWLLSVTDIKEQERLRGAEFVCELPESTVKASSTKASSTNTTKDTSGKAPQMGGGDDDDDDEDDVDDDEEEEEGDDDDEDDDDDDEDDDEDDDDDDDEEEDPKAEQRRKEDRTFLLRRIKVRSVEEKGWQRLDPKGGGWGLFGFHTVPHGATEVVLTEGEFDAMAVWQATHRPAISLPNGCRSLPPEVLPLLERFHKIYLWMDNDAGGIEGAEKFAKKFGLSRCYIVRPTSTNCVKLKSGKKSKHLPKDANDALRMGLDINKILDTAEVTPHERIATFSELREHVFDEIINPDKYSGAALTSMPNFTKIIKGFRRGEMTVLTGPTGSGKTTFLCQQSLDMAEQGINVLWGSFEIKNTRLVHKLLHQFARKPLPRGDPSMREELEAIGDRFSELPMYFMKFHGGSEIDEVLDTMDYAVYVNDVEHIILDNMQFMVSREKSMKSSFSKFDVQDVAIERFRRFATDKNVHITLVVHPKKEEGETLYISSFYGSAKVTQEADTVLILQREGSNKYLDVKKNRFDGTLGRCRLLFNPKDGRYSEQLAELPTEDRKSSKSQSFRGAPPPPDPDTPNVWTAHFAKQDYSNYGGGGGKSSS